MTASAGRDWVRVRTADGSWTLCEPRRGRSLHDLRGARTEARERFARAVGLDRVRSGSTVRLLDVGFGVGLNAAAALEQAEARNYRLELVAMEPDPQPLELARRLPPDADSRFERARARLFERIDAGEPAFAFVDEAFAVDGDGRPVGELELLLDGGFDTIFLDGFAPGGGESLWEPDTLAGLASCLRPGGRLATYSSSARMRASLAAAGLDLWLGPRVGGKGPGTVASRPGGAGGPLPALSLAALEPRTASKIGRRARRLASDSRLGLR